MPFISCRSSESGRARRGAHFDIGFIAWFEGLMGLVGVDRRVTTSSGYRREVE